MKKHLFPLLILSITGCIRLQAQTAASPQQTHPFHRWSIDALAGPAFPVGKYGDLDHQDPGGGPVHTGVVAELSGAYHFNRSVAIVLLANGQQNNGNGITYIQPPTAAPPVFLFDPILIGQMPLTFRRQHWMIARFMTGAEWTLPLNKQKSLDLLLRLLGGAQKTKPADYIRVIGPDDDRLSYPYVHLPWSFSYQIDAGLKWQLKGRVALIAYAGYNGSQPSKDLTYALLIPQQPYTLYNVHTKISTGSLLARAGIEIEL